MADAVTNCMFFVQSLLRELGLSSEIFAEHVDPLLADRIRPVDELRVSAQDGLLIHHSMGHDLFDRLESLPCRKFLVYHNITPPGFFDETDPTHGYLVKGYSQLHRFRDFVEATIAVSEFNARQLRQRGYANVRVIPLLKDFAAVRRAPHAKSPYYDRKAVFRLLFVGRIVPHKCHHQLIDFAAQVAAIGGLPLELVLVGLYEEGEPYKRRLDEQIGRSRLHDRVRLTGRVSDEELYGWYRAADAYVSLSEHEGFGVPLIEAMALDLPVVAYAGAGVADTMADAGIVLPDKSPASLLAPLLRLREDRGHRRRLIGGQRARVEKFGRGRIAAELQQWLHAAGIETRPLPSAPSPSVSAGTHYVMEGPYESSYSLALVNRNLALSLNRAEGCAASIEPAEGVEDYIPDRDAAERLPVAVRELVRPAPLSSARPVTIRNMYPSRPNGMLGDFRLVHLAWEESAIAPPLAELMNAHLDGVLVPTEYCKRAVRDSGVHVPVAVVGHGVDHFGLIPPAADDRPRPAVSDQAPYTFLHISGGAPRKGIEELVTAYCMAFSSRDPVLLVIKTYPNSDNIVGEWLHRIAAGARLAPAIQVIWQDLNLLEMELLYRTADAVVLPSRGEGFNLPAAEAMARGLPVIATRHSGQLDFCNDDNARLVECRYERSTSHLRVPDGVWARPEIGDLVGAMRKAYEDGRPPRGATGARVERARKDAARLRWRAVAARIDQFVEHLDNRPVMNRKLRLGWISTFNTRCGIARYSQHLVEHFDRDIFDITILADDQEPPQPDPSNVVRLWVKGEKHGKDSLITLVRHLIENRYDIAFFQHDFGFYDFEAFAGALVASHEAGIDTYVTLHRTSDDPAGDAKGVKSLSRIAAALASCTRLFVHGVDDMNRLKELGVTQNVVLIPYGVAARPPLDAGAVRLLLGLEGVGPVVGSLGFLLPGKGLPALIHGFALMLRRHPDAFLLLVDAASPEAASRSERERCLLLISQLGLEDRVRLIHEFLDLDEIHLLLGACDVIAYPYDRFEESDGVAVRLGLTAGRPIATPPLSVSDGLSGLAYQLPGSNPADIAEGLGALLADAELYAAVAEGQRQWVSANSWPRQAARIGSIMRGCFAERHAAGLFVPAGATTARAEPAPPPDAPGGGPLQAAHWRAAQDLLRARPSASTKSASAIPANGATGEDEPTVPAPIPVAAVPRSGWLPRVRRKRTKTHAQLLADRARDARRWAIAARHYREAIEEEPDNPPLWVQYGHALKETGRLAEAEAAYRKAIELAPQVADSHLQLGHVLKLQARPVEAAAAYLRALAVDPQFDHAAAELLAFGWSEARLERSVRRERGRLQAMDRAAGSSASPVE